MLIAGAIQTMVTDDTVLYGQLTEEMVVLGLIQAPKE